MSFTEVGSGSQRASANGGTVVANRTCAFPGNVTSGDLLIVSGSLFRSGGITSVSVTDTRSTSYTVLLSNSGAALTTFIAYGVASSSGANTVTVDVVDGDAYIGYSIDEFSAPHATPFDVNGGRSAGTSTSPSDGITTVAANALIIGVLYPGGSSTITPGGSYTQIAEQEDDSSNIAFSSVFRIATAATSYTVDWTLGTSGTWEAQTASFAPAAGGGPATNSGFFTFF